MTDRSTGVLVRADRAEIYYESIGRGPTVVLAHGLGGNASVWFQQVPVLARTHRVVVFDQRGFGRSTVGSGGPGPATAGTDLLALLDHLEVERADLVGQSMGGWAVLGAALEAPHRVRSVVLACTTGGIPPRGVEPLDVALLDGPRTPRPLGEHPAVGERLARVDPARAYLYQTLGSFGRRPDDAWFVRELVAHTFEPEALARLTIPVLLLCAEHDLLMSPARIRDAAEQLPRSRVVEFADRGHSPYFEDPDAWNEAVLAFLHEVAS